MSLVGFGVRRPVPINLLAVGLVIAGVAAALTLRREFFPSTEPDTALVSLPYPGATATEIEQTLAIKVENKLVELDEIEELTTTIGDGGGGIRVRFDEAVDPHEARDEVERAVDSLRDLPEGAEEIRVSLLRPRQPVIRVVVHGAMDARALKDTIRKVRDDLSRMPGMGELLLEGVREDEVRVDVRQEALLATGLSLPKVAGVIRSWMRDIPGGTVKSETGHVRVRVVGSAERPDAIREIVLKSDARGGVIRVGDIATVTESFTDERVIHRYNGEPAAGLIVFAVGEQDVVRTAEAVRAYLQGRRGEAFIPHGVDRLRAGPPVGQQEGLMSERMRAWRVGINSPHALPAEASLTSDTDMARFVEARIDTLARSGLYGAGLVFLVLLLFLNGRVAWWVGVGLVVSLTGVFVLMAAAGITLNQVTLFGLIVVLGLLVDDAIVVAENIQARHDRGEEPLDAAVRGTREVFWPVVATVMTSVVAFLPLTFIRGRIGDLLAALPIVVGFALLLSLLESLVILPAHIGHTLSRRDRSSGGRLSAWVRCAERWRDRAVLPRLTHGYGWLLERLLRLRFLAIAVTCAVLIASLGLVAGGQLRFTFLPSNDAETVVVAVRLPVGASVEQTDAAVRVLEEAAADQPEVRGVSTVVGRTSNLDTGRVDATGSHIAQLFLELSTAEERSRSSSEVIDSIRDSVRGRLGSAERIGFTEINGGPTGADITINVSGADREQLGRAVDRITCRLAGLRGVRDVSDSRDGGQLELRLRLRAGAAALGFTAEDLAEQVRGALYGIDAHVFAGDEEDVNVRVRLDEATRHSLTATQSAWVVSPTGQAVPLLEIAEVQEGEADATIRRVNRRRAVSITAGVAPGVSPESITGQLNRSGLAGAPSVLDEIRAEYPGLEVWFSGRHRQMSDAFRSLPYGFCAAALMIYGVLACLFSSYLQPVLVLCTIPFSLIGLVWGHVALGYDLTFLSLIGFLAVSGIVVNDSLILVGFYNAQRRAGRPVALALITAGRARLRAILLTTLTTAIGLTPLILGGSLQAQLLVPMAISIAMGLVSASVLILLILPCLVMVTEDIKRGCRFLWFGPGPSGNEQASARHPSDG